MISYATFRKMSGLEQEAQVRAHGTFLARRTSGWFNIELYCIGLFYCEIWRQQPTGEVTYVEPFAEQDRLLPYLKRVALPLGLVA
jgi:hypothetical protein